MSNQNTQQALALPKKEVIQPHLPIQLSCYNFTPDPRGFKCLRSIFIKVNMFTLIRYSFHYSSMLFMESGSFEVS